MPLFSSQNWRGVGATVVVELLIVVVLGFAVVRYVEWSSDVNLAEFMSATETSAARFNSGSIPQGANGLRSGQEVATCGRLKFLAFGTGHYRGRGHAVVLRTQILVPL
jgi:hypothetical protein